MAESHPMEERWEAAQALPVQKHQKASSPAVTAWCDGVRAHTALAHYDKLPDRSYPETCAELYTMLEAKEKIHEENTDAA